jgi:hypothetical protein
MIDALGPLGILGAVVLLLAVFLLTYSLREIGILS